MKQFVFLWLLAISIYGQNVMSVPDYSGRSNDTLEIELKISNSNSFVAFQTDVALPSQVSYIPNSAALTGRSNGHMISATLLQNNILRILAFSVNQSTFLGDTGSVAKFKVKLKTEPGSYSLQLINPIISNANSSNILTSFENGSITILSPKIYFYPTDIDFGRIPLWSSNDQYVYIQNQGSSDLVISRLSTENQYFRVVGDTSFTIEPWGNRAITIRFNSLKKGLYSSKLNIRSNDPLSSVASVQLTAIAFAVNELHGLPAYGRSGYPVDLHFSINNMEPITGFQFDIVTPNALSFIQDSIFLTGRRGDHIVTANYISPNRLRVIAFSPTNQTFTDSLGNIVRIKFNLNGTGGDHYYTLENVIISDVSASNIMSAYYSSYVDIASPDIQGNSNINFGDVSVKDTAIFGYQIFNNGNDTLKISSITSNDPSFRIDFTAPLTLPQYTSATLNTFFHNTVKGSYSGRLTIRSNDPDADPFYVNLSAVAYTPNYIIMNDARGLTNDTVVTGVNIDNYEQFVAFQVDVLIPDSLVYIPNSAQLTGRKVDHMLSVAGVGADKIRIVAFSPTQQHFKGNSGEVVKLKFRTGSNAGGYPVILSNGILSNSTSQNVIRGTRDGTLTTYNRPSKPTLIAPTNNSVNISRNPLLTWQDEPNSDYFSLQFAQDSLFINTLFTIDSIFATQYQVNNLDFNTKYFWRVRGNNSVSNGPWSDVGNFTTIVEKPTSPMLASPLNNTKGLIYPITAKWVKSLRVEKYKLQVSTDSLFGSLVLNDSTLVDTTKLLPNLANYSQYYWRVKAINVGGESDWSTVWNFKTLGTPTVVTLVTPENNAVNVPINNVVFNWTKAYDRLETIQRYRFELKTDSTSGTFVIVDTLLTDTTKIVGSLQNLTGYYWRISAKNEAGWGEFTPWNRFTTVKKPIATPTALTAIATAVKKVTLSWTDNSDNELGFIILRKSGDSTSTATLVRIDSVGANITEFIDTTVTDTSYYSYKVMAYNADTLSNQSNFATVFTLTGIRELAGDIPKEFNLYQNYPNPFNPSTIIRFAIPKDAHVEIELYSIHGELVQKLVSEDKQAGYYEISLELPAYASGIYFYRIVATHEGNAEPFVQTRKLILMK